MLRFIDLYSLQTFSAAYQRDWACHCARISFPPHFYSCKIRFKKREREMQRFLVCEGILIFSLLTRALFTCCSPLSSFFVPPVNNRSWEEGPVLLGTAVPLWLRKNTTNPFTCVKEMRANVAAVQKPRKKWRFQAVTHRRSRLNSGFPQLPALPLSSGSLLQHGHHCICIAPPHH